MDETIKAEWVAALRSGKYLQGNGTLRRGEKFCCLGVLCDLSAKKGNGRWVSEDIYGFQRFRFDIGAASHSSWLPAQLARDAGITDFGHLPELENKDGDCAESLVSLNDGGLTFNQIADVINYAL